MLETSTTISNACIHTYSHVWLNSKEFLQWCLKCTTEYLFPFFKRGRFLCANILFKTLYSTKIKSLAVLDQEIYYKNQWLFKRGLREFSIALYYPRIEILICQKCPPYKIAYNIKCVVYLRFTTFTWNTFGCASFGIDAALLLLLPSGVWLSVVQRWPDIGAPTISSSSFDRFFFFN